jgi:hypothetical protein
MKTLIIGIVLTAAAMVHAAESAAPAYSPDQVREVFFLLGMNIEYTGKPAGELGFFPTGDANARAIYEAHVQQLRRSLGLKSERDVWSVVDSFYKKTGEYGVGQRVYFISEEAFEGYGEDAELAYLKGAAVREWNNGSFRLTNGADKSEVIGRLLHKYGCKDVWACRDFNGVPTAFEVRCKPSQKIQKLIDDAVAEREKPNHAVEPPRAPEGARGSP